LLKFVKASKSVSRPPALGFRGVSTTTTFLGIVKEVSEMLADVPYVKGIAGVILQIIKIKEVKAAIMSQHAQHI
jgi:hypothetical protein